MHYEYYKNRKSQYIPLLLYIDVYNGEYIKDFLLQNVYTTLFKITLIP